MSSNYWQTKRQNEQLKYGNTTISRVKAYIKTWEERCYFDGIPDEIPELLSKSGRAPSYKSIAIALLKNDVKLISIGFSCEYTDLVKKLRLEKMKKESRQLSLQI